MVSARASLESRSNPKGYEDNQQWGGGSGPIWGDRMVIGELGTQSADPLTFSMITLNQDPVPHA